MNKLYVIYNKVSGEYYGTSGFWSKTPRIYSSVRNLSSSILRRSPLWGNDNPENVVILEIDPTVLKEISYTEFYGEKKKKSDERYLKEKIKRENNKKEIDILEAKLRILKGR